MKRIVCTGGGSAGHVLPLLPVMEQLRARDTEAVYIGSVSGPERELVSAEGIEFFAVSTDKLRRYASWRTFVMPFNVLRGFVQAVRLLRRLRPDLVLSKGGFVTVPVVAAAAVLRIPIVAHESDVSPGLATRLTRPLARRVCITLPPEVTQRPLRNKEVVTGLPLRARFASPDPKLADAEFCLDPGRPLIMAFGGSLGSTAISSVVRAVATHLTPEFQIVHVCGKHLADLPPVTEYYREVQYVGATMPDLLSRADVIVSRAGMTTLYEILALRKSAVVIPLPLSTSRGDQIENARLMSTLGLLSVIPQELLNVETLKAAILEAYDKRAARAAVIGTLRLVDGTPGVVKVVEEILPA